METSTRVLITGGGPAGIATALSLATRGIACAIAEPSVSLALKAGETIPPNAKPLLEKLRIDGFLNDDSHLPCYGNCFVWGNTDPVDKDFFGGTYSHGWHVSRVYFEKQLQQYSKDAGVHWFSGWRLLNFTQAEDGWEVLLQDQEENTHNIHCNFLVDATGRSCRIARLLGQHRTRLDALIGLWSVMDVAGEIKPFYTFIEATPNGWWYAAPLKGGKLSLAFMTDADLLEPGMNDHAAYLKAATNTRLIKTLVEKILPKHSYPFIHPASTSYLNTRFGESWLAVGDAAYAYDPISSYGIVSALEGGYYAGHAIADALSGNKDALQAYDFLVSQAFDIYLQMHAQQYSLEKRWPEEMFWKRRSADQTLGGINL